MKKQSALAVAVAAAVGGVSGDADAARYTATLNPAPNEGVISYSGNGSSAGNISSSTSTWEYNDVTSQLTQTGGTFNVRFSITPAVTLFRHSITGLVIGNGGAATAATYACTEGTFGGSVGASLCGNYNFGKNQINESTATWGPGTTFSRSIAGDDMIIGGQQSVAAYDSFITTSFVGTSLTLSNASCTPLAPGNANGCATVGGFNIGYTWNLIDVTLVEDANNDTAQVESGIPAQIDVLANDSTLADPTTLTITANPTNGTVQVVGSPGNPDAITVTYESNGGFTGADSFTYRVQDGTVDDTATVSITVVDTIPDSFTFIPATGAALNTPVTSNVVTITGLANPSPISVANGQYSIGCVEPFTGTAANINNNDTVCVRQTSSATPEATTDTTLSIGGVNGVFSVTTVAADNVPNDFGFAAVTNAALGAQITSNTVTITGSNVPLPISITGGEYSIECSGGFTAAAGVLGVGQSVCVRLTSSATPLTTTEAVLTVGGVEGRFAVTTAEVQPDTTPDPFTFADQGNVPKDTVITSNAVTITGINVPVPISVAGGTYSIGCTDTFTAAAGEISNGQTVCVQQTSASTSRTRVQTTLTVGDPPVSDAFVSATGGGGGSSSVDGLMAGFLGLLGLARLRRKRG